MQVKTYGIVGAQNCSVTMIHTSDECRAAVQAHRDGGSNHEVDRDLRANAARRIVRQGAEETKLFPVN